MAEAVTTIIRREKMCKAEVGLITLPPITHMAFGSGGVNEEGHVILPTGQENALRAELLRKSLEGAISFPTSTTCRYSVILEGLTGQFISELGLYDSEGELAAYKTFSKKGVDDDLELLFELDTNF